MLTIRITNDREGTNESASYHYFVFVNQKEIQRGGIQGHNRNDGWASLIKAIAEKHLEADDRNKRIAELECENAVMYAALLEASEIGDSAAMRCRVELQRIARNEAKQN